MDTMYLDFKGEEARKLLRARWHYKTSYSLSGGYTRRQAIHYQGLKGYLHFSPAIKTKLSSDFRLTVHASHFQSFGHLEAWLVNLVGKKLLAEAQISRLDLKVDIKYPFEVIRKQVLATRSQSGGLFWRKQNYCELVFGQKPKFIVIYRKRRNLTRVEARFYGSFCPVRRFYDLPGVQSFYPFTPLIFRQTPPEMSIEGYNRGKQSILFHYAYLTEKYCATYAKKKINFLNQNFSRDIGVYLQPIDLPLRDWWQEEIEDFFRRPYRTPKPQIIDESSQMLEIPAEQAT